MKPNPENETKITKEVVLELWKQLQEAERLTPSEDTSMQLVDMLLTLAPQQVLDTGVPYVPGEEPVTLQNTPSTLQHTPTQSVALENISKDREVPVASQATPKKKQKRSEEPVSYKDFAKLLAYDEEKLILLPTEYTFSVERDFFSQEKFKSIEQIEMELFICLSMVRKCNTLSVLQAYRLGGTVIYIKNQWSRITTSIPELSKYKDGRACMF